MQNAKCKMQNGFRFCMTVKKISILAAYSSPVAANIIHAVKQQSVFCQAEDREKDAQPEQVFSVPKEPVYQTGAGSRKNAEKKALRNGLLGAVAVSLALFVLAFVIFHLYSYIAEKPRFAFVSNGSIEHTIGARGLFIRNESVLNTSANGELVTKSTEGSRAAKGQTVALVVPKDMASTVENLRNVQSQISEVQQELIAKGSVSEALPFYIQCGHSCAEQLHSSASAADTYECRREYFGQRL